MVIYLPVIGAIALASGTVMERLDLNKRRVDVKLYQTASFLAIVLAMLPFIYFFWSVEPGSFSSKNIFIFSLVIFFSIIANLLVFYSLKGERIVKLEPARALEPLFTILLAVLFSIFFGEIYDGNTKII